MKYEGGAHEVGDGVFAYLQPDGSWGWSNAGLVAGEGTSLLVDTLFDLRLTRRMLEELRPLGGRIDTVINTHANGDHCWGNELVDGAHIVASKACAEEMGGLSPDVLATMVSGAVTVNVYAPAWVNIAADPLASVNAKAPLGLSVTFTPVIHGSLASLEWLLSLSL